jgi:putative tricarboxylic transport membrane protein
VSNRGDRAGGAVFLALGAGVCVHAAGLGFGSVLAPEPGFFPWIGGVTLVVLSACLLFPALAGAGGERAPAGEWRRPAVLLAALALYVPLLEPVGYPLATAALSVVCLRIVRSPRWSVTLGVSAVMAAATFVLFQRLLGVELPAGVLAGWR